MPEDKATAPEPTTPEETPGSAEDDVTALRAEVADFKDRLMRTLAEMENLRKRTEREIADSRQYAVASFARDMLTVADNLNRAIAAVPAGTRESAGKAMTALIEGVEVTERGLEQALQKFGVRAVDAAGQKFDPQVHQAMYEVETAEVPPGHVAKVVQTGYVIGERVLRPAMVAVARAPAAAKPEPPVGEVDRQAPDGAPESVGAGSERPQ